MILNLGDVAADETLYIPFHTFDSNDPSESVTTTGLAVTDIEIYKDGSVTQRSSDSGYSLLDTDGIDFDGITGLHGFSVDLSDNTDPGFFAAGSAYWVAVSSITVDGATINFWAAIFTIERTGGTATIITDTEAVLVDTESIQVDTTAIIADTELLLADTELILTDTEAIDTNATSILSDTELILADTEALGASGLTPLASGTAQGGTSTTIQLASAHTFADDELNGNVVNITSGTGAGQSRVITDYTGSSDTATISPAWTTDPFSDSVYEVVQGSSNLAAVSLTAQTAGDIVADTEAILSDTETVLADTNELQVDWANGGRLDLILDAVLADTETSQTSESSILSDTEFILTDTEAILADTNELQTDWTNAGRLDAILDAILADTETSQTSETNLLSDTETILADTNELQADWANAGRLDAILDAVLADTETSQTSEADILSDTETILADTNELQTDWTNAGRLDTILDAILADAETSQTSEASILSDTEFILTDAEAILADTGTDGVKLNATQPSGWADNLVASAGQIIKATVDTVTNTHTPTTTEFQADDITEATADHYNGRVVIFTSGALAGQATDITDYSAVGGIGQFTVTAMTEAPANNDTFIIV